MNIQSCCLAHSGRSPGSIGSCKPLTGGCRPGGAGRQQGAFTAASASEQRNETRHSARSLKPRPSLRDEGPQQQLGGAAVQTASCTVSSCDASEDNVQLNNRLAQARSLDELFGIIHANHPTFNEVNAVTALHRIARHSAKLGRAKRLALRDHELVQIVWYQVVQCRDSWPGLTTSNVAYASAVLGFEPHFLLSKAVERLPVVIHEIGLTEIGLVLWACVKSDYNPPGFLKQLAPLLTHLVTTARYIDERSLCRIPWAYARLDEYNATLFRRFAAVAASRIRMQAMKSPQALSVMLWSYGKAIPPAAESAMLLDAISDKVLAQPHAFDWQDLSNIAWAATRITQSQSRAGMVDFLFAPEDQQAPPVTPKTQQLFACISGRTQELMRREVHTTQKQVTALAIIAKSFATLCIGDEALLDNIASRALVLLDAFAPQSAAMLVWAYARACHQHRELFERVAAHIMAQLQRGADWSPTNIATVVYSYAVLDNVHSEGCRTLLATLARAAEARHEEFDGNAIGATLWGCTVAQQLPQSLLTKLWARAALLADELITMELAQLAQVRLSAQLQGQVLHPLLGGKMVADATSDASALSDLAERCWASLLARGLRNVSRLQQDVMAEVRHLQLPFVMEYAAEHHSLDIAWPEQRLGIEVDGPRHFTANNRQPLGSTLLKRRQLAAAGWQLVSIPFYEWIALSGRGEKQAYIAQRLEAAGRSIPDLRAAYRRQLWEAARQGTGCARSQVGQPALDGLAARPLPLSAPRRTWAGIRAAQQGVGRRTAEQAQQQRLVPAGDGAVPSERAAAGGGVAAASSSDAEQHSPGVAVAAGAAAAAEAAVPPEPPVPPDAVHDPSQRLAPEATLQQGTAAQRALRLAALKHRNGQLDKAVLLQQARRAAGRQQQ